VTTGVTELSSRQSLAKRYLSAHFLSMPAVAPRRLLPGPLMPVRCFTCGTQVATKFEQFQTAVADGQPMGSAMDSLGLWRACCRRMILSQPTALDQLPFLIQEGLTSSFPSTTATNIDTTTTTTTTATTSASSSSDAASSTQS
jgi:DNA-directed RNA polymerase subunit N